MENRDSFGNRFGVLVALAGSAVGLGNLWRFPYLVGNNGGAIFIIFSSVNFFESFTPRFSKKLMFFILTYDAVTTIGPK